MRHLDHLRTMALFCPSSLAQVVVFVRSPFLSLVGGILYRIHRKRLDGKLCGGCFLRRASENATKARWLMIGTAGSASHTGDLVAFCDAGHGAGANGASFRGLTSSQTHCDRDLE
ncbi:hypothetical protein BJX62DRAFT_160169 [Aspergillus germanicus]